MAARFGTGVAWAAGVLAVVGLFWLLGWGLFAIFGFGHSYLHWAIGNIQAGLFPGGLPTPFFWFLLSIVLAFLLCFLFYDEYSMVVPVILSIVLVLASVALCIVKGVTHDILASDYYLESTTLYVENEDEPPAMLEKYIEQNLVEVPIEESDLTASWVPRVASLTGATNVLSKASGSTNNAQLMTDTVTYLYGEEDKGVWTAIRNSGGQQYIYGVSSWNGTGDVNRIQTCRFDGDYALKRNFGGWWQIDLWNSVAAKYPAFFYDENDMWGYCDGDEPIIVIPGVRLTYTDMRTVDAPGGVVTIRGSRSGDPVIEMFTDIKPGDFPGPVYPQRLVNSQRNALDWGAGFWQSVNERFGFDTTSVESQAGNNSNYLLKSREDGRLYWVTPMKPQGSEDQTLIAYSMIPADEVGSGLNPQTVYVLNEDDPRVVNLDDLFSYAQDAACNLPDPNFCTDTPKGKIVEFLPVTDTHWQAFGEIEGRVKYLVDLEVGGAVIQTRTTTLLPDENAAPPQTGTDGTPPTLTGEATCDEPASLTDQQLADCLAALANELAGRSAK